MINYKLRLFTPRSSYGAKEKAPKSQLCACSFQDSLRQKNWTLEQIRKFPDTIGYVWTAENDSNTLRVDAKIFVSAKKYLRKKKIPDTCGHGLSPLHPRCDMRRQRFVFEEMDPLQPPVTPCKPISFISAITVRLQIVLGRPCFLPPDGVHLRLVFGMGSWKCPSHYSYR